VRTEKNEMHNVFQHKALSVKKQHLRGFSLPLREVQPLLRGSQVASTGYSSEPTAPSGNTYGRLRSDLRDNQANLRGICVPYEWFRRPYVVDKAKSSDRCIECSVILHNQSGFLWSSSVWNI
jgi:hypothetical protein